MTNWSTLVSEDGQGEDQEEFLSIPFLSLVSFMTFRVGEMMIALNEIETKITHSQTISRQEAEFLYKNASNEDLQRLAQDTKSRFHPTDEATYLIMAIVNYTNICVAKCDYCAFYRLPHQSGGYLLDFDQVCQKIDELVEFGGTLVGFNGGFHPGLRIADYAQLFQKIRSRYGNQLEFYEMTVAEFMFVCKRSKLTYEQGAKILADHGTRWVTGGGAEILDDAFRMRHSPGKYRVADYFAAQSAILDAGIGSTATMVIGFDESLEERFNHLESLRRFQEAQNRRLTSFLCWNYKPDGTQLAGQEIPTSEYLRWLAICRIYLDNFRHIRTSVLTKNEDALLGLKYGANDFDLPTEDEVTQRAGATIDHDFEKILNSAKKIGFSVKHRKPFELGPSQHGFSTQPAAAAAAAALRAEVKTHEIHQ